MTTNKHFMYKETWNNYDINDSIKKYKIPTVLENIPNEVSRIIDVGCGNGILTNVLFKKYEVTGVDMSEEALKYLKCNKIHAYSDNIPVGDDSFDMVISSQLLEHLTNEELIKTIEEFRRITRKYILITVPNNEILEKNYTKCPACGFIFNVNGHLQSFSKEDLFDLLGDKFQLLYSKSFGSNIRGYNKNLIRIRHKIANKYYIPQKFTVCPNCGNTEFPEIKGNIISKICNGFNRIIASKNPYWLLALYKMR